MVAEVGVRDRDGRDPRVDAERDDVLVDEALHLAPDVLAERRQAPPGSGFAPAGR